MNLSLSDGGMKRNPTSPQACGKAAWVSLFRSVLWINSLWLFQSRRSLLGSRRAVLKLNEHIDLFPLWSGTGAHGNDMCQITHTHTQCEGAGNTSRAGAVSVYLWWDQVVVGTEGELTSCYRTHLVALRLDVRNRVCSRRRVCRQLWVRLHLILLSISVSHVSLGWSLDGKPCSDWIHFMSVIFSYKNKEFMCW